MTIWKFPLDAVDAQQMQQIMMPTGARILCVQMQKRTPCIWALVDPSAPKELRAILTLGTGQPAPGGLGTYLGTYQILEGSFVFHVFEGTLL